LVAAKRDAKGAIECDWGEIEGWGGGLGMGRVEKGKGGNKGYIWVWT